MNVRNWYTLSLLALMSGLLYASEKKDTPLVDPAEDAHYRGALALANADDDQKFLIAFIEKHPEYLNEKAENSLISVFSKALIGDGCDTKIYKNLMKEFLKQPGWTLLHAIFEYELPSVAEASKLDAAAAITLEIQNRQLGSFRRIVLEAWQEIVVQACEAVKKQDCKELDRLLVSWPTLLNPPAYLKADTTLLHEAAKIFDSKKPQTVEVFSLLMKKGASWTLKNNEDKTVEETIKPGHAAFESFTHNKQLRENPSPITYDSVKQKVVNAKSHWKYIVGGLVGIVIMYIIWPKRDSLKSELDTRSLSKPLL